MFILFENSKTQINTLWDELIIGNLNNEDTLIIKVTPIGFVYNNKKEYSPYANWLYPNNDSVTIFGGSNRLFYNEDPENQVFRLNHISIHPNSADSNIGYGKYKVEFDKWGYDELGNYYLIKLDSFYIDFSDSDYPYGEGNWINFTNDFLAYYYDSDSIVVQFSTGLKFKLNATNRDFKMWDQLGTNNSKIQSKNFKSCLSYLNFPIVSENYCNTTHIQPNECYVNLTIRNSGTYFKPDQNFYFKNSGLTTDSNVNLTIGDSSKLVFDGTGSFLKVNPNSNIRFGENAGIVFINGASLIADGANFTSLDSNSVWYGIMLNNSGVDTIINCNFSKAKTALEIISNTTTSFVNRVIKNNTFNVPPGGDYRGIYGENNFRITISDNVFNMPVNLSYGNFGIYLKSNITGAIESLPEENETPLSPYSIYVINNTFNNGAVSLLLTNYTSSYLPVFVKNNVFNNASVIAILGRNITGTIRDNRIMNFSIPMGIHIINSSPALYNNTVNTGNASLHTIGSSYPDLSPFVYEGIKTWKAGRNKLSSLYSDDIQLVNAGNVYVNNGENKFTVSDTAFNYHIYGKVDTNVFKLMGLNNCWTPGNNARIYLRRNYVNYPVMYETGVNIDCETVYEAEGIEVYYLGNGMYDTAYVSPDTSNSELTEEELLYNQGQNYISAVVGVPKSCLNHLKF
jgi:hypothetical protein